MFTRRPDKLQIISFQTYGSESHLYIRGRALEDEEIDLTEKGVFRLLLNTWKRFETDEIRHTPVIVHLADGRTVRGETDLHGYYRLDQVLPDLKPLANSEGWVSYEIAYADTELKREVLHQNRFPGEMLIPADKADFGVISDIDDTILHTGVVSSLKWRVIINTVFKRATRRRALDGAAALYHLLHRGPSGENANPIFYVSHSPWNLYRYLELFLRTNKFPKGPIVLRSMASFRNRHAEKPHKQHEIVNILKAYPKLPFILFGDSGERDADIYKELAELYPGRVLAIYLRNVRHRARMERVRGLFASYTATPVLFVEKSEQAVEHARANGFIKS